jgi:hypothetical protein
MPRSTKRAVCSCGLFALIAIVGGGCQRGSNWSMAPVEGTVTMDGQPLTHIEVMFYPDLDAGVHGPRSVAVTDASGHYRLRADNGENGALADKHRVVVRDLGGQTKRGNSRSVARKEKEGADAANLAKRQETTQAQPLRVGSQYANFDSTTLRVEIQSRPQVIDFDVNDGNVEVKLIGGPGKK